MAIERRFPCIATIVVFDEYLTKGGGLGWGHLFERDACFILWLRARVGAYSKERAY